MTIVESILDFSRAQADWVQDGLRRLATQDDITDQDKADLLALLKADNGIPPESELASPAPLSAEHFAPATTGSTRVSLLELKDIKRANRLASGQSLRFAAEGITLIYGDNGSGKSGYCRLLKKLCRIREGAEERVLPNAYEPQPQEPAEAIVRFRDEDGHERSVTWSDGTQPPSVLRQLSVFDSKAAPLYVDRDGKVEYLPYGLDLLPRLGRLQQDLANEIRRELGDLEERCKTPLPAVPAATLASGLLAKLTTSTALDALPSVAVLSDAASFSSAHSQRLAELEGALSENALASAKLLENAATAAIDLALEIGTLLKELDDASISTVREEVRAAREARAAADLSAKDAFTGEPLPGVGTDPWRRMFEHARAYSAVAYPGAEFPVVGRDSRCVLCHQELSDEASERLQRFDAYVRGAAEREAVANEAKVKGRALTLNALQVSDPTRATAALVGFDGADESLRVDAEAMLGVLRDRRGAMIDFTTGKAEELVAPALPIDPVPGLTPAAETLTRRSEELKSAQADPDARQRLERERDELLARRTLTENRKAIELRRTNVEMLQRLKGCLAACDTASLSRKNTALRREFITEAFQGRLADEIRRFEIEYLPLKAADRTERGESFLGVSLETAAPAKPQDILSEGERKALALAAFFAEVGGLPEGAGLIFDDPVSSLDHSRRRKVAERIVDAAGQGRQVVVFTHDLVFYNEVQLAAASATPQVPVVTHEVRRTVEHGFGTVDEGTEPWFVAKTGRRISGLENKLARLRDAAAGGGEEQRDAVVAFYTDLRETWERLVEAELLNGVVTRFCKDVKTQSLREVVVDDDDHRRVYHAMKRASEWSGHSPPLAGQAALPTAETAAKDLEDLRAFLEHVKQRKNRVSRERQALEEAPKAVLS